MFQSRCATLTFSRAVSRVNGGFKLDMMTFTITESQSLHILPSLYTSVVRMSNSLQIARMVTG